MKEYRLRSYFALNDGNLIEWDEILNGTLSGSGGFKCYVNGQVTSWVDAPPQEAMVVTPQNCDYVKKLRQQIGQHEPFTSEQAA